MKNNYCVTKKYLVESVGFKENTASDIVRQAKVKMVELGYPMYSNRRLGIVPTRIVEEIIGFSISSNLEVEKHDK